MTKGEHARRRVGMRDVARAAGVSAQTVSRVINDDPRVRDDTRRRVRETMASLDYRVNNAARALGTDRSRTVGVVVSDATLYGPAIGVAALEAAARAVGLWIVTAYADAGDRASVDAAAAHLVAQGVDGMVLVAQNVRTVERLYAAGLGVPVIALHGGDGAAAQAQGMRVIVDHLMSLGHRRVAWLGGPAGWVEETARTTGFTRSAAAAGLIVTHRWSGDWSAASGAACAPAIAAALGEASAPTAVVVANDQMALGVMAALGDRGLSVPGDVSVTGFDDNPDAAHYRPALTTVRVDVAAEARRCVAAVMGGAAHVDADAARVDADAAHLIVRASTGPARVVSRPGSASTRTSR